MSRNSSQTRLSQNRNKSSLKDVTNKLSKVQIHSKRRFSSKSQSVDDFIDSIKNGKFKRIVVLAGAGISTPSGIPDFRTPGTGLYDNLQRYNIPYPEAIFELSYFYRNPQPFFHLAKELYPGRYFPNLIHYFIRYLHEQKILHRVYTQNIDGLERMVGIPPEKIVEAHGTFSTATCLRCREKYQCEDIRQQIFENEIPKCTKTARCNGVIKPDIVFFGEDLPRRFQLYLQDLPMCDCCIVMGTSLAVYPFADIVDSTSRSTTRLLINRQIVGSFLSARPNDLMMIGDLELNIKDLLTKLDVIDQIMISMKQENAEHQKNQKDFIRLKSASTTKTNQRLKEAERFLTQQRKYSTVATPLVQPEKISPSRAVITETTKSIIERHNNALIIQRRRSKSAFPILPSKESSSSSSSESLDSSLSETELSPFSFKRPTNSKPHSFIQTKPTKVRGNPILNATLKTGS